VVYISDRLANQACILLTSFTTQIFRLPLSPYEHLIAFAMVALARHVGHARSGGLETIVNHALIAQVPQLIGFEPDVALDVVRWALLTIRAAIRFDAELIVWVDGTLSGVMVTGIMMEGLQGLFFEIPEELGSGERGTDEI
jgi:hypothetical protein